MTEDQLRWAEALAISRMHGDHAASWVAGRIIQLLIDGDQAGVERLEQIAWRVDQLSERPASFQH